MPCYKQHQENCKEEAARLASQVEAKFENRSVAPVDLNLLSLPSEDTVPPEKLSMLSK